MNTERKMIMTLIVLVCSIIIGLLLGIIIWNIFGKKYRMKHPGGVQNVNLFIALPFFFCLYIGIRIILYISKL